MKAVFTGGGTGGHLYPAIAIADALRKDGASIEFVGTADRLESTIVPKAGYALHAVSSAAFVRGRPLQLFATIAKNAIGFVQSVAVLARLRPDIVIATGGYVCFPVVLAARYLRLVRRTRSRVALLEPNAKPGLTNRLLAPLVSEIWGAFPVPGDRLERRYVYTGIPVRSALYRLPARADALERLGLSSRRRTLLVMGGSLGARSINDAFVELCRRDGLPEGWQAIHVTGERDYDRVRAALSKSDGAVRPYLDDLTDAYAAADLVLARAGASTIGELVAVRKPAILVPYPHASDDHQTHNAAQLADAGAAVIVADSELLEGKLPVVLAAVTVPERLAQLGDAARTFAALDPVATIVARIDALAARRAP